MSFADRVREELTQIPVKHPCCRRAMLGALLLLAVPTGVKKEYTVRLKQEGAAQFAAALLKQQFGKMPELHTGGACGHRYYDLGFSSPAAAKLTERLRSDELSFGEVLGFSCDGCEAAFLRGCFLFFGTVNDPQKSFHLEFLLPNGDVAERMATFLEQFGYPVRRISRNSGIGLYYKSSASVEELITLMGAHHIVFDVINSRIEREIRNNENRATNCVAKNIEKSISASARQLEAIELLREHGSMESLSEGVRETARLRLEHPDASLDELRGLHSPSISKSGLNHRLQKILEAAQEVKEKGGMG